MKKAIKKVFKAPFIISYIPRLILNNERKRDLRYEYCLNRLAELEHENYAIMEYVHYVEVQMEINNSLIRELLSKVEKGGYK